MTVNEYLNSFIQLSRYATEDIDTDEKKRDMFLEGLNDDIQFQQLNVDYIDFQHMVDKAIVIESNLRKWRRMAKGRCHSLDCPLEATLDLASRSPTSFSSHRRLSERRRRCKYNAPISDATADCVPTSCPLLEQEASHDLKGRKLHLQQDQPHDY
jgi:hypothetical protein